MAMGDTACARRAGFGGLLLAAALLVPATWAATEAPQIFADGQALLTKGDFDGALKAFRSAAQADPKNEEYLQKFAILRRVVKLRADLPQEKDTDAWFQMARALFAFYQEHRIREESLGLAAQMHEKVNTGETAEMLGDAQLEWGQDADAAKLLTDLPADKQTPRTTVMRGIALAHTGKAEDAKVVADKLTLPKDADANYLYDSARLYALTGSADKALAALTSMFEATPGPALEDVRATVKTCKDFETLARGEAFAAVLKTESKVKAACGTKEACGKCPSAAKHGKSGAAGCGGGEKKDEKAGKP